MSIESEATEQQFPIMLELSKIYIPWDMIAPHEKQAMRNHQQTLTRLADRGGLSPEEAIAVLSDRTYFSMEDEFFPHGRVTFDSRMKNLGRLIEIVGEWKIKQAGPEAAAMKRLATWLDERKEIREVGRMTRENHGKWYILLRSYFYCGSRGFKGVYGEHPDLSTAIHQALDQAEKANL